MSYVIEDGVPIPPYNGKSRKAGPQTAWTQHLDKLTPGQSTATQDSKEYKAAEQFAIRSRPRKFAFRKMRDGWRIWRTE